MTYDFKEINHSIENPDINCEIISISHTSDGAVWIANGGGYLVDREQAQAALIACAKYLFHIAEQDVKWFNDALLSLRQDEGKKRDKESAELLRQRAAPKGGYVYLMHNPRNGFYKIGRSVNPEFREATLQAEEPEIITIHVIPGHSELEALLHAKYAAKRVRGEWFTLNQEDVDYIKSLPE